MRTRATRRKLEQALELIEAFVEAENVNEVVDDREIANLDMALSEIREVESRLYRTEATR